MSFEEYDDLRIIGRFRAGEGMMEGKWFADTLEGVQLHAASLYPDGRCRIVAAELPDEMLGRLYRSDNLDRFGPATYLEATDFDSIAPILEPENRDR